MFSMKYLFSVLIAFLTLGWICVESLTLPAGPSYYTVFASHEKSESPYPAETIMSPGMPAPWMHRDIGSISTKGDAKFNGDELTIQAAGTYSDSASDQLHYVYVPLDSEGEITVRFVPQPGYEFSRMGIMMRESLVPNSPQVSLLLSPGSMGWETIQFAREFAGHPLKIKKKGEPLTEPVLIQGRLTGYYWLRLQRKFNSFFAFTSEDGKTWTSIGSTFVEMKKKFSAGIAVTSGVRSVLTTVKFDHVSVPGWTMEK